jgi:hypothetical protein
VTPQGENSIPHPDATKIVQLKQQEGASLLWVIDETLLPAQYASKTFNILKEGLADVYSMQLIHEGNDIYRICMNQRWMHKEWVNHVEIRILRNHKYDVCLKEYDHYDEYYFDALWISAAELIKEIDNIKQFAGNRLMPEFSLIQKKEYPNMDDYL